MIVIALLFFSFILSFLFINLFIKTSLRFNLLSKERAVPFTGGIGFSLALAISYLSFILWYHISLPLQLVYLFIFSSILLLVELIDDLMDFSLKVRIFLQVIIIFLFLLYGKIMRIYFLPFWLNYLLSFLWIMGITNAFNLIDIGDGLCAGVSLITSLTFLTITMIKQDLLLSGLFLCLCAVLLAFLLLNLPSAKVFMGNSGSHFLGFLFAGLSMFGDYATLNNPLPVILPLLILAFPIIDTLFLIVIRFKKGIVPLRKSNDHIFLRLISSGYSTKKTLLVIYIASFFWGLSGIFIIFGFNLLFLISISCAVLFTLKIVFKAAQSH